MIVSLYIAYNSEIIAYQRVIIKSLLFHEFVEEENNKKFELIKEILNKKSHLFTKVQLSILQKAYEEVKFYREEGNFSDWVLSEIFFNNLTSEEKEEMLEIETINDQPLIAFVVKKLLKEIENKILLRRVV